jgi:NADH-quinone oxidoreductase subunit G
MFGAVTKAWFAKQKGIDPDKIFCVSIMPCVAKKHECTRPGMNSAGARQDVDAVITNRELARMLRACHMDITKLDEEEFDDPLGESSGAATIFGNTGGVMEAALRTAHYLVTKDNPAPDEFAAARKSNNISSLTVKIGDATIRAAIASGLGNARELVRRIKNGEEEFDFVEIMACPGGCVCGGGQPIDFLGERSSARTEALYNIDKNAPMRFSHENRSIKKLYEEFLSAPLSEKSHELLHTIHKAGEI